MSRPSFAIARSTRCVRVSYRKSVIGPSRSERKYTSLPTHIGEPSFEFSRGTRTMLESARSAM
jgi:hypothetical protein